MVDPRTILIVVLLGFLGLLALRYWRHVRRFLVLLGKVRAGTIILILVLFGLFNTKLVFGPDEAESQQNLLIIYSVVIGLAVAFTAGKNPLSGPEAGAARFFATFIAGFLAGFLIFKLLVLVIPALDPPQRYLTSAALGLVAAHALVIAVNEELVYRWAVPLGLGKFHPIARQLISAGTFSITHWSPYGGDTASLLTAAALGFGFGLVREYVPDGLFVAMGLHAGWNISALGAT